LDLLRRRGVLIWVMSMPSARCRTHPVAMASQDEAMMARLDALTARGPDASAPQRPPKRDARSRDWHRHAVARGRRTGLYRGRP
jgi:hypothetical protein